MKNTYPAVIQRLEPRRLFASVFVQTNLVSDGFVPAAVTDVDLKNPWGLAYLPSGPFWVADNGTSKSTAYNGAGVKQQFNVNIPGGGGLPATPTGIVANSSSSFYVGSGDKVGPAKFIFVGEDGGISGWNESVDANNAMLAVDNYLSASYKGATIATFMHSPVLYVTDFKNGKVQMYDRNFQLMGRKGAFKDPNLPIGYAPFNVQDIGGAIVVTYAKKGADGVDVPGRGHGVVDIYSTGGALLRRMQRGKFLNSPWGIALAPATFGQFAGDLLIGQFGSGRIAAFHPKNGKFLGYVNDNTGLPIQNNGLWAVSFGNNGAAGSANTLFFTAGLNDEADGLFGKIELTA
jgi:uncharacterized protein (TIGR03118 family)